jgi:hypothetical protein
MRIVLSNGRRIGEGKPGDVTNKLIRAFHALTKEKAMSSEL